MSNQGRVRNCGTKQKQHEEDEREPWAYGDLRLVGNLLQLAILRGALPNLDNLHVILFTLNWKKVLIHMKVSFILD